MQQGSGSRGEGPPRNLTSKQNMGSPPPPAPAAEATGQAPAFEREAVLIGASPTGLDADDRPVKRPVFSEKSQEVGGGAAVSARGEVEVGFSSPAVAPPVPPAPAAERKWLDPWYATYADAVSAELVREKQGLVESLSQLIWHLPSGDDRVQITNPGAYPWRCICCLIITAADGSRWCASGWLAGPRTVVTAGHCLYLHNRRGWARQVEVQPARSATAIPHRLRAAELWSVEGWTERQREECDYGAIVLNEPVSAALGALPSASMPDGEVAQMVVNIFGYPVDKEMGTLWGCTRRIREVQPRQLVYDASTFGGLSGCPVFYKQGESRIVVGIHNDGDLAGSTATRITPAVSSNIQRWISA